MKIDFYLFYKCYENNLVKIKFINRINPNNYLNGFDVTSVRFMCKYLYFSWSFVVSTIISYTLIFQDLIRF